MHNQQQQNHEHYPEEIDLVDVASVVYRRKATLVLVVLCSVIVAFGYWFSLGEKIQVSAAYKTGTVAILQSGEPSLLPLMSSSDSSQLLQLIYFSELVESNRLETGTKINQGSINIEYTGPDRTILELVAVGSEKNAQALVAFINSSLELLLKNHAEKLDDYILRMRTLINTQKDKVLLMEQIATLETPNATLAERSLLKSNIMSLEATLAASTNSVIIKRATVNALGSKGPTMYVAGGFVAGLFLGCFVVFFLELYSKAKIRAAETA